MPHETLRGYESTAHSKTSELRHYAQQASAKKFNLPPKVRKWHFYTSGPLQSWPELNVYETKVVDLPHISIGKCT